jgi:ATP-dependent helicase/nuclease subunit B
MNAWLDSLELAFPRESLRLRDWISTLEAGLASLTVGVIPPALDQVLVGAIDRSRNPDLKLALVLGLNEGVFPAAPSAPNLLSDSERDALHEHGTALGPDLRDRLARERYLGYIACTRASQNLVATYARHDADGKVLNPSPFVSHLKRLFPELEEEEFHGPEGWPEAEHACELIAPLVAMPDALGRLTPGAPSAHPTKPGAPGVSRPNAAGWSQLLQLPALKALADSLQQLRNPDPTERLSPALAERLFGPVLRTSVSRLEGFAACPFKFFVHSGLRAEERKLFELDAREQGSFQHEVLKVFHEQLRAEGKRWRDLTPSEARERLGRIATALTTHYHDGLLSDTEQSRFTARMLTESLQEFVEVLIGWMREQYEFEPVAVELGFGGSGGTFPGWEMDVGAGHKLVLQGRIDRVDLWPAPHGMSGAGRSKDLAHSLPGAEPEVDSALCVVMDYKSNHKQLDPVLMQHGVQLQLLAYLGVLRQWPDPRPLFGVARLIPAGVFYVNLRGRYERASSRAEVLADADAARKLAYRHTGRFDAGVLRQLDRRPNVSRGDQFNYRLNQDGGLRANSAEALEGAQFEKLLENAASQLREMGARIFAGDTVVDPYRKGGTTPCEYCDYRAICRIDPWTHRYRVLRKEQADED